MTSQRTKIEDRQFFFSTIINDWRQAREGVHLAREGED